MNPKFKVGDQVNITWRPNRERGFPSEFNEALKDRQIIARIETNKGFTPEFYYSYYFEEPGNSRLSRLSFFEVEIELAVHQPVFVKKTELPEI